MSNHPDWKGALQAIIDRHNHRHAKRPKDIGFKTGEERARGLFLMFRILRQLGFDLSPQGLGGHHVAHLFWYLTGDPRIEALCRKRGVTMPEKRYAPKYLQSLASTLRTFCGWIGKPGLVLPLERYVADPARIACSAIARQDKGWEGHGLDIAALLQRIARIDERVAIMCELQWVFGLRRKEAVMLQPHRAVVPAGRLSIEAPVAESYLVCLEVERGTKGGRLRLVPIVTEAQRAALERAARYAEFPDSYLGHPGKTLRQVLDRYKNVLARTGITTKELGVTGHGLRHQFAGDKYFDLGKIACPVRGGDPMADRELLERVLLAVSRQLGHNRTQITSAYLGALTRVRNDNTATSTSAARPASQFGAEEPAPSPLVDPEPATKVG